MFAKRLCVLQPQKFTKNYAPKTIFLLLALPFSICTMDHVPDKKGFRELLLESGIKRPKAPPIPFFYRYDSLSKDGLVGYFDYRHTDENEGLSKLIVYEMRGASCAKQFTIPNQGLESYSDNGNLFITFDNSFKRLWRTDAQKPYLECKNGTILLSSKARYIAAVDFSDGISGLTLYSADPTFYSTKNIDLLFKTTQRAQNSSSCAFTPDEKYLIVKTHNELSLYTTRTRECLIVIPDCTLFSILSNDYLKISFSAEDSCLVSFDQPQKIISQEKNRKEILPKNEKEREKNILWISHDYGLKATTIENNPTSFSLWKLKKSNPEHPQDSWLEIATLSGNSLLCYDLSSQMVISTQDYYQLIPLETVKNLIEQFYKRYSE